jgi:hypothetical protein
VSSIDVLARAGTLGLVVCEKIRIRVQDLKGRGLPCPFKTPAPGRFFASWLVDFQNYFAKVLSFG